MPSIPSGSLLFPMQLTSPASTTTMKFSRRSNRSIFLVLLCLALLHSSCYRHQAMANPIPSGATSSIYSEAAASSAGVDSLENNFRSQVANDGGSKVYIDTLTPEEAEIHRQTGQLPKRTIQLIEKVLKSQEQLKNSDPATSSVGASDLIEELYAKTRA